jgi:hypothetical protein
MGRGSLFCAAMTAMSRLSFLAWEWNTRYTDTGPPFYIGKIGLIALKDHALRKIPLKDPASGKYH